MYASPGKWWAVEADFLSPKVVLRTKFGNEKIKCQNPVAQASSLCMTFKITPLGF